MYVQYRLPPQFQFPTPPLGGCSSCAGLGDAAYDAAVAAYQSALTKYNAELNAYNTAMTAYNTEYAKYESRHKTWALEKKAHGILVTNYATKVTQIDKEFAAATIAYNTAIAKWQNQQQAYTTAIAKWNADRAAERAANAATTARIVKAYNLSPPSNFGNCLSQADHDKYKLMCQTASVKGLGGFWGDWQAACGMAELPICKTPPPQPKAPSAKPQPPVKPAYPSKPPTLRAEPQPPVKPAIAKPVGPPTPPPAPPGQPSVPTTTPTVVTPADEAAGQKNLVMVGLIAVVALGGGYALYRTFKKPKAAA